MATFRIHQDAEKENPTVMPMKEKVTALGKAAVGRSNFGVRNNGNAYNSATISNGVPINKVAFREVANIAKVNDENAGQAKKSTIVSTVVEQYKAFSVYEDKDAGQPPVRQPLQPRAVKKPSVVVVEQTSTTTTTVSVAEVDKENSYICPPHGGKTAKTHKEFVCNNDDDFNLDGTPMSVSDVLSPMSVDKSHIALRVDDDSKSIIASKSTSGGIDMLKCVMPRNDRQRFFEVIEYQRSILQYFRESEQKHRPKPHYMRRQSDINHSMRTILVDWLVEVSEEYNLDTETLYLSVSYIDRFLSQMSVVRSKLQLVGTAAMFIASKYEEIYPPDVSEFVFITDDTYNKAQVLRMEQIILKILTFDLCTPTAYVFINTYAVLMDLTDEQKYLTLYICELSLLEADPYLRFLPSVTSAAALALARHILGDDIWSIDLQDITNYRLEELREVFICLCKLHNGAGKMAQQAIQEKYKADRFKKVSTIVPVECDEATFDEIVRQYNEQIDTDENEDPHNVSQTTATSNENVRRMISLMFN